MFRGIDIFCNMISVNEKYPSYPTILSSVIETLVVIKENVIIIFRQLYAFRNND